MKKLKKITRIFSVLLACSFMFISTLDIKANVTNITPTGYTHTGTAVNPADPAYTSFFTQQPIEKITTDTGVGVCIEPWKLVEGWTGYTVSEYDRAELSRIWYYAYVNTGQTMWDYAVGQLMVWEYFGYIPTSHTVSNYAARKAEVNNAISKYYLQPSFDKQTITINAGESVTLTDTNNVLSDFKGDISNLQGITVTRNGNQLTISATVDAEETSTFRWSKIPSSMVGQSFVHRKDNGQDVATLMRNDPTPFDLNIKVNKFGSLELTKFDEEALAIPNTEFKLSYNADMSDEIGTYTTGANGKVQIDELKGGSTVYYQEVSVPAPLILDTTIRSITITPNEVEKAEVINLIQKGTAKLVKEDAETGNAPQGDATFEGAVYELKADEDIMNPISNTVRYTKDSVVATRTIRADGTTDDVTDLYTGKYYWQEKNASEGYLVNPEKIEVDLSYAGSIVTSVSKSSISKETVIKGKVQLFKVSTDGSSGVMLPLANAEFTGKLLSEVEKVGWDNAKTYSVITTNALGLATTSDLPYGKYLFRETQTPDGKITAPDFTISVTENDYTYFIAVNNAPFKSYVKMVKQDADGKDVVLNNVSFQIKDKDGNIVKQKVGDKYIDTFSTDKEGYIVTPLMLTAGIYTIDEIETPNGFLDLEEPVQFEITNRHDFDVDQDNDPIVTVVIKNEKPTAEIIVKKSFENPKDNALGGAVFKLTANSEILDPATGEVIYNVGDSVNLDIAEDGLYAVSENGTLSITGLPMSTGKASYKLVEVSTLDGYVLDETEYVFDFAQENLTQKVYTQTAEIENKQTTTEIVKNDVKGNAVVGSELAILDKNGNIVDQWITTEDVHVVKGLVVDSEYTIRELSAPKEFVLAKDVSFTVKNTLDTQTYEMIDKQVAVNKVDAESKDHLPGAEFVVTNNKTKDIVDRWTSDGSTHFISGLIEGHEYTLTELTAPERFKKADPIEFTVTDDKELQLFEVENKQIKISTTAFNAETLEKFFDAFGEITVTDTVTYEALNVGQEYIMSGVIMDKATEKPLIIEGEEVRYKITFIPESENGSVDMTFTFSAEDLDAKELVVFEELNTVIDKETTTVAEHKDIEDKDQTVKVRRVANVQVNKVDLYTSKAIKSKDFEFTLYADQECKDIVETVNANTEDGTALFENIKEGTWYIKETKAPTGYLLSTEKVKVEVNDEGVFINDKQIDEVDDIYSFVYANEMIPMVETGDPTNANAFVGLLLLSGITFSTMLFRKKKKLR